jgi:hypothetical protein
VFGKAALDKISNLINIDGMCHSQNPWKLHGDVAITHAIHDIVKIFDEDAWKDQNYYSFLLVYIYSSSGDMTTREIYMHNNLQATLTVIMAESQLYVKSILGLDQIVR